jgi:hypothetical protein
MHTKVILNMSGTGVVNFCRGMPAYTTRPFDKLRAQGGRKVRPPTARPLGNSRRA